MRISKLFLFTSLLILNNTSFAQEGMEFLETSYEKVVPSPSISQFLEWAKLSDKEWANTMIELGLEKTKRANLSKDCVYYASNEIDDMDYAFHKCDGNYIEMDFGAFSNGEESLEIEVQNKIDLFVESLKDDYVGEKTLSSFTMDEYSFNKDGTTYSIILFHDDYCAGAQSCARVKIYFRWS
ncbi:MAG: hypothetical protein ACI9O4_000567 [Chitinophagales bacterium]|jgi:hypothetical protein